MADVLLKDITGKDTSYVGVETVSLRSIDGETTETFVSERLIQNQVQADWTETDTTSPAYINNKPKVFEAEDELPEIKNPEEDNGKVLGVVDGKWAMMSIPESDPAEQAQTDWNENDEDSVSYIKNRPFGTIAAGTIISEGNINCDTVVSGDIYAAFVDKFEIVDNMTYIVELDDGEPNEVTATNSMIWCETDDVFCVFVNQESSGVTAIMALQGEHTYTVTLGEDIVKKMDPQYLPMEGIPEKTTFDAGKVLTVDADGTAVWETPASGLPGVTTAENGAFLRVIDGKWAAVALTDVSIEGA